MIFRSIRIASLIAVAFVFCVALSGTALAEGTVSLNKATADELIKVLITDNELDVPEDVIKALVEYREKNGAFKDPLDLRKVPGMTDYFYEELNPQKAKDGDIIFDPEAEPALAPSKC